MSDGTRPVDLGLAEFVSRLMSEVLQAVAVSQEEQEHRLANLQAMAAMDVEEFASLFVSDEEVDAVVKHGRPVRGHIFFPAGPAAQPAARIAPAGTAPVPAPHADEESKRARRAIAAARQDALQELVRRGVPRVLVDAGRVNAKLTFHAARIEEATPAEAAPKPGVPLRPLMDFSGIPLPHSPADVRLLVKHADPAATQTSTVHGSVFGEIELSFKVVI